MISQMLKIIWNARRKNALLALQIFIAFILLAILSGQGLQKVIAFRKPLGFNYENIWHVSFYDYNKLFNANEQKTIVQTVYKGIESMKNISYSEVLGSIPYSTVSGSATNQSPFTSKAVEYTTYYVGESFKDLMQLEISEGRWFNELNINKDISIVITQEFKELYFGTHQAIGERVGDKIVIGIVEYYRSCGELENGISGYFKLLPEDYASASLMVKVPAGSGIELEEELVNVIKNVAPGWRVKSESLTNKRKAHLQEKLTPLLIIGVVVIFLFINILLSMFGLLWYSISQRRIEIGLRRSLGATKKHIRKQLIGEMLIITSIGIIPAIIVLIQIQIYNLLETGSSIFLMSLITAILLTYTMIVLCASIPGVQAAKIQPVRALSEE